MHLIATYLLVLVDWALSTSEKVPSPFLLINLYSKISDRQFQFQISKFLDANKGLKLDQK